MSYKKLNAVTKKDHFPLPLIDQMLDTLARHQIMKALEDQETRTFTSPYGTFAFQHMPFGLCNAPGTF